MLYKIDEAYNENEPKIVGVGKSGSISRIPQRNCKIKIGTAERPDSCRGGDYNLVHLSEVGIWKATEGKKPEDIVRSACSGILLKPYTMIVYESTANGTGNFFHREYTAAKEGKSQFEAMFVHGSTSSNIHSLLIRTKKNGILQNGFIRIGTMKIQIPNVRNAVSIFGRCGKKVLRSKLSIGT